MKTQTENSGLQVFNDDGGWCWFQDERAIIHQGKLIVASVASGFRDPSRRGRIEVAGYDLTTGEQTRCQLGQALNPPYDDHYAPALLARPDGRILAAYTLQWKPDTNRFTYRISSHPGDPAHWDEERSFSPSPTSAITYSNLHHLQREQNGRGRTYNFFRGLGGDLKPAYVWSDDAGLTWTTGNIIIPSPSLRPYVKYASDGKDTIHLIYTEGHPFEFGQTSVYHVSYREGWLHRSDGTAIARLSEGLRDVADGTRIFPGDAGNLAWTSDIHLDREGRPYVAYSVHKKTAGGPVGVDHRYRYARWTGARWLDHEIAYAGSRLCPGQDDYTGNVALDPHDPDRLFISTNADPVTGAPLISAADGQRHWELYRGHTADAGATWHWNALTTNSTADNLRPIVPAGDDRNVAVLWLRGRYRDYTDYDLEVVGHITQR